jgi:hypothetical protein
MTSERPHHANGLMVVGLVIAVRAVVRLRKIREIERGD